MKEVGEQGDVEEEEWERQAHPVIHRRWTVKALHMSLLC
jgi:hypothetical protein